MGKGSFKETREYAALKGADAQRRRGVKAENYK
jgi:hypothetical protein